MASHSSPKTPTPTAAPIRHVLVAGDVTVDWNLSRSGEQASYAYWSSGKQAKASGQPGGAVLLGQVVERMAADCFGHRVKVWYPHVDPKQVGRPGTGYSASFSLWAKHPKTNKKGENEKVWRVEQYLGADPAAAAAQHKAGADSKPPAQCRLVILDDAGLGFDEHHKACLGQFDGAEWILLKMSAWQRDTGDFRHLATGPLFDHLRKRYASKMVVLVNIDDLRLRDAAVSRGLSWEQTAQDLAQDLFNNPCLAPLAECAHVVVRLGAAGVFLYSRNGGNADCRLFYDPVELGDSWETRHPGGVIGYTVCLTAALARHLLEKPKNWDWKLTFQRGIGALRALHLGGYNDDASSKGALKFPFDAVARELAQRQPPTKEKEWGGLAELCEAPAPVTRKGGATGRWTILGGSQPDALDLAEKIVLLGPEKALVASETRWKPRILSVPMAKYGSLQTIDRQEIESLRSIGRLVQEYFSQGSRTPLSFAVFGPPGCGKSFAIEQLAGAVIPGKTVKLTFNLSQISSPDELSEAFHQVRDSALRGEMPLVFWDEFDAKLQEQVFGWLKYFLAPMQDGCFQAGPLTHPIGRAIFAFAGSVCSTMQAFEEHVTDDNLRDAKGRDFVSRLKGFVNILGPDPQPDPRTDPHFILRRALILRGTLERERPMLLKEKGELRIDAGVLRALLFVSRYRHGVRSLASVIAMSVLDRRLKFERSCLPPAAQLNLHVDAEEFLTITNGAQFANLDNAAIETMAEETHRAFYDYLVEQGCRLGARNDDEAKTHTCFVKHLKALSENNQNENRNFARAIPNRLVAAGYVVAVLHPGATRGELPPDVIESLAEMEHERWIWSKLLAGFRYANQPDKDKHLHNCLLAWNQMTDAERRLRYGAWADVIGAGELPDKEKQKDRILVRAIPRILAKAGLQIAPIPRPQANAPSAKEEERVPAETAVVPQPRPEDPLGA